MKIKLKYAIIASIATIFLLSCDSTEQVLPQDFDRTGQALKITVTWHENERELNQAFFKYHRKQRNNSRVHRKGFAIWANPGRQPYWCSIHTLKPTKIDDDIMLTMGHELTHCLIGTYHPELY